MDSAISPSTRGTGISSTCSARCRAELQSAGKPAVEFQGRRYRHFDSLTRQDQLTSWANFHGRSASAIAWATATFVSPPYMLSAESTAGRDHLVVRRIHARQTNLGRLPTSRISAAGLRSFCQPTLSLRGQTRLGVAHLALVERGAARTRAAFHRVLREPRSLPKHLSVHARSENRCRVRHPYLSNSPAVPRT